MTEGEALEVMELYSNCFPGRIPSETVAAWALAIAPFDRAAAVRAVARVARECEHPSLVALVERMGIERPKDRAALMFDEVRWAIGAHGSYRSVDFADRAINAALRAMGGWLRVCSMDGEEFEKWGRKEFERLYALYGASGAAEGSAGDYLAGVIERENGPRGFPVEPPARIESGVSRRRPQLGPGARATAATTAASMPFVASGAARDAVQRAASAIGNRMRGLLGPNDAAAGERVIRQTESEAEARRAELARQAAEALGEGP